MHRELVLPFEEIRYVGVMCTHCKTELILDLSEPKQPTNAALMNPQCPKCGTEFPHDLATMLNRLKVEILPSLAKKENGVTIRIPLKAREAEQ